MVRSEQIDLLSLCALEGVSGAQWQVIAREASTPAGFKRLLDGIVAERGVSASRLRDSLVRELHRREERSEWVAEQVAAATSVGARLVTVLDTEYPVNLRRVHNLPPFLFVLGELKPADIRSVAVVGTRDASELGVKQASKMARHLAARDVTVVSGMAAGIDTAAHEACLDAGGRTLAVMGTGILGCFPKVNLGLKERIAARGAVVSQFWPNQHGSRHTFPMRNVVTSGISQATVVIEASKTSGARMQARLAHEHGKMVFVIDSLTKEDWAREAVAARRAVAVSDVDEIARRLQDADEVLEATELREQLALQLT